MLLDRANISIDERNPLDWFTRLSLPNAFTMDLAILFIALLYVLAFPVLTKAGLKRVLASGIVLLAVRSEVLQVSRMARNGWSLRYFGESHHTDRKSVV